MYWKDPVWKELFLKWYAKNEVVRGFVPRESIEEEPHRPPIDSETFISAYRELKKAEESLRKYEAEKGYF